MTRRKYKFTRSVKKEKDFPKWYSFFVVTEQGSYKMSYKGRKEARKQRIEMENLLKVRMK